MVQMFSAPPRLRQNDLSLRHRGELGGEEHRAHGDG